MKKIHLASLILLFSIIGITSEVNAQFNDSYDNLRYRKWRITLAPPVGSNGIAANKYTAKYSLNLLVGYNGGLDGAEIGGLFNYNKEYSHGFQIAGLVNSTGGEMFGANIAGLVNYAKQDMAGIQVAGLVNASGSAMSGLQFAGVSNYAKQDVSGIQFAGFGNFSRQDISGLQFSGIVNASDGDMSGIQLAGVANVTNDNLEGIQAATVLNFSRKDLSGIQFTTGINVALGDVEGLQMAGILSYAGSDISGLQIAGISTISRQNTEGLVISGALNYAQENASGLFTSGGFNIAKNLEGVMFSGIGNVANDMSGVQFSGIFNIAETVEGVQVGLFNFAKEFQGLPVGFISLYGNGRKNLDFRYSDAGFSEYTLTTGTHRVYNMAIFGYNTLLDRNVYRIGMGIGLEKNILDSFPRIKDESMFVNQEFSVVHNFEEKWTRKTNLIFSYKFLVGKRLSNGLSIYGGPSYNVQVTRVPTANDYTWYSLWSPEWKGRTYRFWVGFTAGIRLFKQKQLPTFNGDWDYENEW
tara:strand:- start:1923 stop:3497 length:1575 start_codon:yes stop_codon:yes gene_type:complete